MVSVWIFCVCVKLRVDCGSLLSLLKTMCHGFQGTPGMDFSINRWTANDSSAHTHTHSSLSKQRKWNYTDKSLLSSFALEMSFLTMQCVTDWLTKLVASCWSCLMLDSLKKSRSRVFSSQAYTVESAQSWMNRNIRVVNADTHYPHMASNSVNPSKWCGCECQMMLFFPQSQRARFLAQHAAA